jgi:hypothetical protein
MCDTRTVPLNVAEPARTDQSAPRSARPWRGLTKQQILARDDR